MKNIYLSVALLLTVVSFLASCSKSDDYLNVIPKDTPMVASINLKALGEKAGINDKENKEALGKLTDMLKKEMNAASFEKLESIIKNPDECGIDLGKPVYAFYSDKNDMILAAKVTDKESLANSIKLLGNNTEISELTEKEGYSFSQMDGYSYIAFNENTLIAVKSKTSGDSDKLKLNAIEVLNGKSEESIASDKGFIRMQDKKADIAIVFDFDSMLMSEIEDGCGKIYSLDTEPTILNYRYTHAGMYRLVKDSNYNVDYVGVTRPELFASYKVLYFPYYTMLNPEIIPYLQKFLDNGGIVIADEGFGLRTLNTWMQPYDIDCKPLMTARLKERRFIDNEQIIYKGQKSRIAPFKSQYEVQNADSLMVFADGTPALQCVNYGKGKLYLFGFSIGYSYYKTRDDLWKIVMGDILESANVEKEEFSDHQNGVYEKRLVCDDGEAVFIFNNSEEEKTIEMDCDIKYVGGFGSCEGRTFKVPANGMGYVIASK